MEWTGADWTGGEERRRGKGEEDIEYTPPDKQSQSPIPTLEGRLQRFQSAKLYSMALDEGT